MKEYPSIPGTYGENLPCLAFYKLDGSNLRFEYSRKRGWYKFGSRTQLIDATHQEFGCAIDIFKKKYGEQIAEVLHNYRCDNAIVYCEFFGPNSFAGQHDVNTLKHLGFDVIDNDPKDLVLFDVNIHKKGLVSPRDFIKDFGHLHIPAVIYEGNLNQEFIKDVHDGKYPVREGVVCKGGSGHKLWMRKVKTAQYLQELKYRFKEQWQKYE